jgi:hypothetical protein
LTEGGCAPISNDVNHLHALQHKKSCIAVGHIQFPIQQSPHLATLTNEMREWHVVRVTESFSTWYSSTEWSSDYDALAVVKGSARTSISSDLKWETAVAKITMVSWWIARCKTVFTAGADPQLVLGSKRGHRQRQLSPALVRPDYDNEGK